MPYLPRLLVFQASAVNIDGLSLSPSGALNDWAANIPNAVAGQPSYSDAMRGVSVR